MLQGEETYRSHGTSKTERLPPSNVVRPQSTGRRLSREAGVASIRGGTAVTPVPQVSRRGGKD